MIKKHPTSIPLYSIGDLVLLRGFGLLLTKSEQTIGVVIKGPYSYRTVESYHDLVYFEWWCYDILVGSELVRMLPENFLLQVKKDEQDN